MQYDVVLSGALVHRIQSVKPKLSPVASQHFPHQWAVVNLASSKSYTFNLEFKPAAQAVTHFYFAFK